MASVPAKCSMKACGSGWWCSDTRRQAQRGRPALGAPPERREVLGRERDAQRVEQRAGLVEREAQVGGADLGQAAVEAQAAEPDRRVRPRDDDEPQRRRREAREPLEILVDRVDDLVEVVEHEHDRLLGALRARRPAQAAPGPSSSARAGSPPAPRPPRRRSPGPAPRRTPRQKRRRSASSVSSDSQATGPGGRPSAIHELSSALLPAPAGAATSVSGPCTPASSRSSSRGRSDRRPRPAGHRELRRQQRVGHGTGQASREHHDRLGTAVDQSAHRSGTQRRRLCAPSASEQRFVVHRTSGVTRASITRPGEPRSPAARVRSGRGRSHRTGPLARRRRRAEPGPHHRRRAHARHAARAGQRAGVRRWAGWSAWPSSGRSSCRRQRCRRQRGRRARDMGRRPRARARMPARAGGGQAVARAPPRGRRGGVAQVDAGDRHVQAGQGARDGRAAVGGQPEEPAPDRRCGRARSPRPASTRAARPSRSPCSS